MKKLIAVGVVLVSGIFLGMNGFRISEDGIRISRNLHEVDKGKLYRSAQLTGDEFREVILKNNIRTVINLQGKRPTTQWWQEEKAVTDELGVHFINLEMTVQSIPKRFELLKLLKAFENAERPILLHCRQGADRTGEAVALYNFLMNGVPKEQAIEEAFSFKYFYVELFAPAKKYFLENFVSREWAFNSYDHCDKTWEYADQRECPPTLFDSL